jgi:regulator of protease activity HflC (stomatin/prohibitin superfamily)
LLGVAIYMLGFALFSGSAPLAVLAVLVAVFFLGLALLWLWRGAIVEIEQGTTGVRSRYGKIEGTLSPGWHYLWLNRQLAHYGVRILGANIPDVQLPDQYQQHLATRERVAKELAAYEREWELTRKQRIDTLLMDIERSKKDRDARLIEVKEARNRARQDIARMLEEQETEAQRVRLEIETRGRAALTEAENEATALRYLGQAHRDNRAVVRYELARRRVEIGEKLMQRAPRPVLIRGEGGEQSALSTLILARLLPQLTADGSTVEKASEALRDLGDGEG